MHPRVRAIVDIYSTRFESFFNRYSTVIAFYLNIKTVTSQALPVSSGKRSLVSSPENVWIAIGQIMFLPTTALLFTSDNTVVYRVLAVLGSFGYVKSEPVNNCRWCLHPRPGYSLHSASTRLTSREDPGHGLWSVLQFNYLDPVLFAVVSSSGTEMVTLNLADEVGINRLDYSS